jgi:hypothetical protein
MGDATLAHGEIVALGHCSWQSLSKGRAPILREYVRIAPSGRQHFPLAIEAPLSDFDAIAGRYPVYRIDPS